MTVLVLGGTQEGKQLAERLTQQGLPVIYSIAGLVRQPSLPCPVISGGFRSTGGLAKYLRQHDITAVVDATHPYAQQMTTTAIETTDQLGIGYWRFQRPAWQADDADHWCECPDWQTVVKHCQSEMTIFLSCGQLTAEQLRQLPTTANYVYRTAVPPSVTLPDHVRWQQGIGPFEFQQELSLLTNHKIDILVTKNSGGPLTAAKLVAARQLAIPVLMLSRPEIGIMSQLSTLPLSPVTTLGAVMTDKTEQAPARWVSELDVCVQELQQYHRLSV